MRTTREEVQAHHHQHHNIGVVATFENLDLSHLDLSGLHLPRSRFENSNLTNTNLEGTDLSFAQIRNSNLAGANLANATLTRSDITNSALTYATLDHADLAYADLYNCNLTGATFTHTNLPDAWFGDSRGLTPHQLLDTHGLSQWLGTGPPPDIWNALLPKDPNARELTERLLQDWDGTLREAITAAEELRAA